ncbi:MAG: hypothetical protein ACO22S_05650, partial [Burkholderiaceae bacterium]
SFFCMWAPRGKTRKRLLAHMSSLGRLLQPFVEVTWGDLNLSDWDYGDKMKRPVVYGVSVDLDTGDEVVNKASMEFDPSPVGFKAYVKCVSEEYAKKPIKIKFGYEKGSTMETVYFFQNVDFSTGKDQSITVHLSGLHKNKLTSHWWNEYVGNGQSEFTIKELFDSLAKKIDMKMEYDKGAEKIIKEKLPKMSSAQLVNTTLGGYMLKVAKGHGLRLEYPTGSEDDNKKIIVRSTATNNEKLEVTEKQIEKKVEVGSKRKDRRLGFIIGPTLATSINRKTNPFSATGSDADSSYNIRVTNSKAELKQENPVESSATDQSAKPPSGSTSSFEQEVTSKCTKKGKALTGDELTKCRKQIREQQDKKSEGELSEMDTSVFMVPYMVGIKPYDFVVFPSLKGDYIEDWEVHSVSYKQEGGAVVISINGKRPQVGKGNLLDENSLKVFSDKVKEFKQLKDWEAYYWNIK